MSTIVRQLVATFHHVVNEKSGNDITIARAKTMISLVSLTWPSTGIVVTPHFITPERIIWKSTIFDSITMGGSFRRDPVGDDASIIIDDDEPKELIMLDEMCECASFIPLFGRQQLKRFNLTLAALFLHKASEAPLPLPGSEPSQTFHCADEYRQLHEWLKDHGVITSDGLWQVIGGKGF